MDKITTKNLYDVIYKYVTIKEDNSLLSILFDWEDKRTDDISKFSYIGSHNETIYVGQDGYSYRLERIFDLDNGFLKEKWIRGIRNNHKGLLDNIENVFKEVPMSRLDELYKELYEIYKVVNLSEDLLNKVDKKTESISLFYNLFIYTIGDSLEEDFKVNNESFDSYISQVITSVADGKQIHIEAPNLKDILNEKYILVSGPGGLGKTTFLNKLYEKVKGNNIFNNVFKIDLTLVYEYLDKKDVIEKKDGYSYIVEYISKVKKTDPSNIDFNKYTLLLLDGLNEIFIYNNLRIRKILFDELNFIKSFDKVCFIVATRESEGAFSYRNVDFISDFKLYSLSGVREIELNSLIKKYGENLLEFLRVPLYYNVVKKAGANVSFNNKYELLKEFYHQRYEQSLNYDGAFFAFYIVAPKIAAFMNDKRTQFISKTDIEKIVKDLFNSEALSLLITSAKEECLGPSCEENVELDRIVNLLLNYGPLNISQIEDGFESKYRFFHDEIRKYLIAFNAFINFNSLRLAKFNHRFCEIDDIYLNLNIDDDSIMLFRNRLDLDSNDKDTISLKFSYYYQDSESYNNIPLEIVYTHTAFLISEFIRFGNDKIDVIYNAMMPLTNKVIEIINDGNFEDYLNNLSESEIKRCKLCLLEIITKHSEFYRKNNEFEKGFKILEICDFLFKDNEETLNQRAKIYFKYIENSINIKEAIYNPKKHLFNEEMKDAYDKAMMCTRKSSDMNFNLSINLLQSFETVPNPIFFLNDEPLIDYVDAFNREYRYICESGLDGFEILYTVRQALNLLIKGYVKVREGFSYRKDKILVKDAIILSDMNTFNINESTINLAKDLLEKVEGYNYTSLNYFKGVIKYYDKEYEISKKLLEEDGSIQAKIILNNKFGYNYDLDGYYENTLKKIDMGNTTYEVCDPIYYGIFDAENLEISLNKDRVIYFEELKKKLPKLYQIVLDKIEKNQGKHWNFVVTA